MASCWWWAWTLHCWVCMSCQEWNVIQGSRNLYFIACKLNLIYLGSWGRHQIQQMHDHIYAAHVLHTVPSSFAKWPENPFYIAPLSSAWLMCGILSHRKQLYLQLSSQWGYSIFKHNSGESNKLWGNSIFHSGRLVSLCYWAQQSKAAERVLDTQVQPFQTMHV